MCITHPIPVTSDYIIAHKVMYYDVDKKTFHSIFWTAHHPEEGYLAQKVYTAKFEPHFHNASVRCRFHACINRNQARRLKRETAYLVGLGKRPKESFPSWTVNHPCNRKLVIAKVILLGNIIQQSPEHVWFEVPRQYAATQMMILGITS